ncbi:MAG: DnaJ family domain-containing protein [Burkholderiales bacterium]
MPTLDEHIALRLRESQLNGELAQAKCYGKPLDFGDGYFETPEELRLGYKILKDSGYVPAEVEMFKQVAALREQLGAAKGEAEQAALRARIVDLGQRIAVRLEKLPGARRR